MQLEELQAIWETQTERPVFSVNDFGLHLALYQVRERARRRLFWGGYFPAYVGSLVGLVALLLFFFAFYFKPAANDFPMNAWDYLVFLIAASALVLGASSMFTRRRKHEQEQSVFAPSLRQEIERGIAQIDFETSPDASRMVWRYVALFYLAAILFCWEVGRLNGNPLPWKVLWMTVPMLVVFLVALVPVGRQATKEGLRRKQALQGLLAKLDENPAKS
jgi:di/tricarboxylate transporter